MAGKPVLFHPEAVAEYEAAVEWYFERSELAASKFVTELSAAVETISNGPHRWPAYIYGTRKFTLQRFPYIVVYRDLPDSIQVVAVAHGHRRPGYWKKRSRSK